MFLIVAISVKKLNKRKLLISNKNNDNYIDQPEFTE